MSYSRTSSDMNEGQLSAPPLPPPEALLGEWYIVYASLPFWHDKRKVKLTYFEPSLSDSALDSFDDSVAYQTLTSSKIKVIHGTNTACQGEPGSWNWRGKGLARIAGNRWALLGYGNLGDGSQWMATFSGKSFLMAPAVTVLTRKSDAFTGDVQNGFDTALKKIDHADLTGLAEKMVRTRQD